MSFLGIFDEASLLQTLLALSSSGVDGARHSRGLQFPANMVARDYMRYGRHLVLGISGSYSCRSHSFSPHSVELHPFSAHYFAVSLRGSNRTDGVAISLVDSQSL
jgi:hypothetical protein